MSRRFRVWDSVRHAQAYGLARRIQCAAKLRSRHRAKMSPREVRGRSVRPRGEVQGSSGGGPGEV